MWLAGSGRYIVTPTQTVNNSTFWHANRLKTHQLNPTSIQPALILGAYFQILFFLSKLKRQQCSLVNVRPVWSPRFFGPALTFCWAKNKVHRVQLFSMECFAVLIPTKWTQNKQSQTFLYTIQMSPLNIKCLINKTLNSCQCLLICQKIALCLLFCQQRSHSQCSSASTVKKGFTLNM